MTKEKLKTKALAAISLMAEELKEVVEMVEFDPPLTEGYYDQYVNIIRNLTKEEGKDMKYAIALALMEAGANIRGVSNAIALIEEELV